MEKLGSLLSLVLILFLPLLAQAELKVKSYLSAENVEIGDIVTYTIELTSDKEMRKLGESFSPPKVRGLEFQDMSQGSSTSMSYNNGSVSRSYTLKYNLNYAADKEGAVRFSALDLGLPEKIKTMPQGLRVYKVLPEALKTRRQQRRGGGATSLMDQIFGRQRRAAQPESQEPLEFFTEVEIDKTEVYKGEQLTAAWYIYVSPGASLGTFDTLKFPTLKGFWKEDVNFASRFYWKNVTRGGKRYMRALLSSYALTPYKEGSYIIDPFELRTVVIKGYFNSRRKVLKAKSDPVSITVKPLPKPIPETFTGGVGRFKIDSIRAGRDRNVLMRDPFEVSFRVVGDEATTKFLKTPKLDTGEMFRVYKAKEEHKFVASQISSYKIFKYSLIPQKEGVYRFPDLKLTFLSPETGEYYSEYVKLPTYKVLANDKAPKVADEVYEEKPLSPEELKEARLKALKYRNDNSSLSEFIYFRPSMLWTLILLLVSAVLAFLLFQKTASVSLELESLASDLEKRASEVAKLLQENKRNQALTELINILSLLVGAVNGKRYGAEKEIEIAVESLPASLRSSGHKLKNLNDDLQEMRFGTSLESYTNKAKLETCLEEFKKLFLEFREYLR